MKKQHKKWKPRPCKLCRDNPKIHKTYAKYITHRRRRHPYEVAKAKESCQRSSYGQSKAEYDAQLKKQGGVCICGRAPKNVALHQDHGHQIARLKIECVKTGSKWRAYNLDYGFVYYSRNRKTAKRMVQLKLKRKSRRGALCWHCNAALKKVEDNWKKLALLAEYMKYWEKKQGWNYEKKERIKRHYSQHGDK